MQRIELKYEPLARGEIRLLRLGTRRSPQDPVIGNLETSIFGPDLRYDALSYVWGEDQSMSPVLVNGQQHHVRQNLYNFLEARSLRSDGSLDDHILWIDQICINQADTSERSAQVQMMTDIYASADQVVIWFGRELYERQDLALYLREAARRYKTWIWDWYKYGYRSRDPLDNSSTDVKSRHLWPLIEAKYWSRLWVAQEVALGKSVVALIGEAHFDMLDLMKIIMAEYPNYAGTTQPCFGFCKAQAAYRNGESDATKMLDTAADMALRADCLDKRDKFYALYGILRTNTSPLPKIDYTKGVFEVYRSFCAYAQSQTQKTDPTWSMVFMGHAMGFGDQLNPSRSAEDLRDFLSDGLVGDGKALLGTIKYCYEMDLL